MFTIRVSILVLWSRLGLGLRGARGVNYKRKSILCIHTYVGVHLIFK